MTTDPTTAISRQRRPRGRYPKTQDGAAPKREKRIPEYLEARRGERDHQGRAQPEGEAADAPTVAGGSARLRGVLTSKCGTCRSIRPLPRCRVRSGKGGKTRLVPVHPELHGALSSALAYGDISQGRLIEAHVHDRMALGEDGGETR